MDKQQPTSKGQDDATAGGHDQERNAEPTISDAGDPARPAAVAVATPNRPRAGPMHRAQMIARQDGKCFYCQERMYEFAIDRTTATAVHPNCRDIKTAIERRNRAYPARQPTIICDGQQVPMPAWKETMLTVVARRVAETPAVALPIVVDAL
jgi:hypothetical protein